MAPTHCPACGQLLADDPVDEVVTGPRRCQTCGADVGTHTADDVGRHPLDDWDRPTAVDQQSRSRPAVALAATSGAEWVATVGGALLAVGLAGAVAGQDRRRLLLVSSAAVGALLGLAVARARA